MARSEAPVPAAPRVVAISGASSGIGRATADRLGAAGWRVALGARRAERIEAARSELRAAGVEAWGGALDVSDADSVARFFEGATAALGACDAAVHCAAHARPGDLAAVAPAAIEAELASDLRGAVFFAREAVRGWLAARIPGDLVLLSSTSAVTPWPWHTAYAASKAGVEQMARSLALEVEGSGIRSTLLRVGNTVGTAWSENWSAADFAAVGHWQRLGLLRHAGLLRPGDVAAAIEWILAQPRGSRLDLVSLNPAAPPRGAEATLPPLPSEA